MRKQKMKRLLLPLLAALALPTAAKAEIKDPNYLLQLFNESCIPNSQLRSNIGMTLSSCGCFVNKAAKGMTIEEIDSVGEKMVKAEESYKSSRIAAENLSLSSDPSVKKFVDYTKSCNKAAFDQLEGLD